MRRLMAALLVAAMWASSFALAEGFRQDELEDMPGYQVFLDENGVDTVVRPEDQPYMGEIRLEGGMLITFLDFVEKPEEGMTFLRLTASVMSGERLAAEEMTLTVGDNRYVFALSPVIHEYDTVYYEDYSLCLTDESLPMLKAMARAEEGMFPVAFTGESTAEGLLALPGERAAEIYDIYVSLGGHEQNLAICRDLWPVRVIKSK